MSVTLMIQGTTSDAGKSAVVTGLCRALMRRGFRVAPFKPQNMALNSAVTANGGEIGRSQAIQAYACGIASHTDMNPVLLKPNTDKGAQVIIHGRAVGNMNARTYHDYKAEARRAVLASHERLSSEYDVVVVEGAGSPAEINLRENDIANMGFAEAVNCPVVLVADIDRGGVFAHIVGTLALLSRSERRRTLGFVINRFRGDLSLLQPGLDWLEGDTDRRVYGVLPYLHGLHLEAEDALTTTSHSEKAALRVVVPALPHLSNHTDFDPLRLNPQVDIQFIGAGAAIPPADLIILPGSKNVRADLAWLRDQGWESSLSHHLRYGGRVLGICGGYQMLGKRVSDPEGLEGPAGDTAGLCLLNVETVLRPEKQLKNVTGTLALNGAPVAGYEIHAGVTTGADRARPAIHITNRTDGALSPDGQVLGTYLHGLFESSPACEGLLRWVGLNAPRDFDYQTLREAGIERLADAVDEHLDMAALLRRLGLSPESKQKKPHAS